MALCYFWIWDVHGRIGASIRDHKSGAWGERDGYGQLSRQRGRPSRRIRVCRNAWDTRSSDSRRLEPNRQLEREFSSHSSLTGARHKRDQFVTITPVQTITEPHRPSAAFCEKASNSRPCWRLGKPGEGLKIRDPSG